MLKHLWRLPSEQLGAVSEQAWWLHVCGWHAIAVDKHFVFTIDGWARVLIR